MTLLQRRSFMVGMAGCLLCILGYVLNSEQFFHSYLFAYTFWLGLSLGSLALWMVHNLTGGAWGNALRDICRSATRVLPWLTLLYLPIALGLYRIYPWAGAPDVAPQTDFYLNEVFFFVRAAIFFGVWLILTVILNSWTAALERSGNPVWARRLEGLSGPGLVLYGLSVTFAAIDWIMSLEPNWASTIFGVIIAAAQLLGAFSLAVAVLSLAESRQWTPKLSPEIWNDLGSLLLTFVMLWTYMSFSQLLLIWSGNLPEEIPWYIKRSEGGWEFVAAALALFYFALPFVFLLSRGLKRGHRRLGTLAWALVAMSVIHQYWLVAPAFAPERFAIHWLDPVTFLAIGGIWLAAFFRQWNRLLAGRLTGTTQVAA